MFDTLDLKSCQQRWHAVHTKTLKVSNGFNMVQLCVMPADTFITFLVVLSVLSFFLNSMCSNWPVRWLWSYWPKNSVFPSSVCMSPTSGVTRRQVWSLTWSVNRFGSTWGEFIFGIRFIADAIQRGHLLHRKVERRAKESTQTAYFIDEGNVFGLNLESQLTEGRTSHSVTKSEEGYIFKCKQWPRQLTFVVFIFTTRVFNVQKLAA